MLQEIHADSEVRRQEYQNLLTTMGESPGTEYARLAALCGLRITEAVASWAEEAQQGVPNHEVIIDPRRPESRTAKAVFKVAPVAIGVPEK